MSAPPRGATDARVVVYSRPGCHLCEAAVATVAAVCAELDVDWTERSIAGDADLEARFGHEIPVTFVDGRQHDFWRVDAVRLRRAIRQGGARNEHRP